MPERNDLDTWIDGLTAAARALGCPSTAHRYGPDPQQVGDLRLPAGPGPHPVVVVLHGGAFRARYDRHIMTANAVDLTRRGYATWNLEYRRTDCGGGPRESTADVAAGIELLPYLPGDLDLDRVVVLGHSAGGYLALWAAHRPDVRRVVALAAVSDFRRIATGPKTPYARFAGGTPEERPGVYDYLDLTRYFITGTRHIALCGRDDGAVRLAENRALAAAATAAGEDYHYAELPQTGHFTFMDPATPAWACACAAVAELVGP